jgi:hypothetical protein
MEEDCMPTRHRSAWRRRLRSRTARIAIPVAIPVVLAVVLGVIIAVKGSGDTTRLTESALANCAAPSSAASPSAAAPGGSASAAPVPGSPASCPSTSGGSSAAASPTATSSASAPAAPPVNPEAGRPDLAETNPVDPAGAAISLTQTPAEAANTLDCELIVPPNPLSAQGMATPWQLTDGCAETNPSEQAFVEATILAPGGQLKVYDPLVITQGTTPAVAPKAPVIPRGAQVIINTGFNGNNLVLGGTGAVRGNCVDAFGNSIISQTAACNAPAFYADANAQIARHRLRIPRLGTGSDGQACETTESFSLIDQDQSDNVISTYLLTGNAQTAQATAANGKALAGAAVITNGSDDALLGHFVDPALGCTPFTTTDTTSPNGTDSSQALNTLSAVVNQRGTQALLPVNDPQLLVDGQFSIGKTNTYRMETDQPPLARNTNKDQNAAAYCQDMVNIQPAKLQLDMGKELGFTSPVPATGNNLATFMGARLGASFTNLNCQNFGLTNPVTVTTDGNGAATAVSLNVAQQQATVPGGMPASGPGGRGGRGGGGRGGGGDRGGRGHGWSGGTGYNRSVPSGRHRHKENGAGM